MLIILTASSTAYSQATETKAVKVSVLKAMGKDLEKCKRLRTAFEQKSRINDSVMLQNIKLFNTLEQQQIERINLQNKLDELNKEKLKITKQKGGWLVPALLGVIAGTVFGASL